MKPNCEQRVMHSCVVRRELVKLVPFSWRLLALSPWQPKVDQPAGIEDDGEGAAVVLLEGSTVELEEVEEVEEVVGAGVVVLLDAVVVGTTVVLLTLVGAAVVVALTLVGATVTVVELALVGAIAVELTLAVTVEVAFAVVGAAVGAAVVAFALVGRIVVELALAATVVGSTIVELALVGEDVGATVVPLADVVASVVVVLDTTPVVTLLETSDEEAVAEAVAIGATLVVVTGFGSSFLKKFAL